MRFLAIVLTCVTAALAGCGALSPRATRSFGPTDFGSNPMILFDGSTPVEQVTLRGVKLGDPKSAIRANRIDNETKDGWVVCGDRCKYKVSEGVVTVLGLWDTAEIQKLKINTQADVEKRFGKPEQVDDVDILTRYRYGNGHITLTWNKFENALNAINVSR